VSWLRKRFDRTNRWTGATIPGRTKAPNCCGPELSDHR
jgi:hypothetical protein